MILEIFRLFWAFFKIGLFTIGGGYAMIPMIEEEVITNGWFQHSALSLIDFIAVSESTPGPFAINIATFIGMTEAGIFGALAATIGVVLPSFTLILLIAKFFSRFNSNRIVKAVMTGIRPVIVGILLSVMLTFLSTALFHSGVMQLEIVAFDYKAFIIFLIIFLLSRFVKKISPILLIILSAGLGIILYGLL